ncbi:MAG: isoprenylcysteine carboxylmethyltransferase family protein [Betaproteobacteria bacterium]|nr:isoprenylcysteine carboxylmethyltransferase family protein [Betaproteobacteria bacterium]
MRVLENRIPPPVVTLFSAAIMWVLARWWPLWRFEFPSPLLVGLLVASVGGVISILGICEFRRAKTTVNPLHPEQASSVVTTGIYRFTRNPMYLGLLFALLGCFLAFGGMSSLVGLPAFIMYINRFQIQPEEKSLHAKFGSTYTEYQARVRRWL